MELFNELTRMLNPELGAQWFRKLNQYIDFDGVEFNVEFSLYGFDRQFCPIEFNLISIYVGEYDWHDNLSKLARDEIQQKVIDKITRDAIERARRNSEY